MRTRPAIFKFELLRQAIAFNRRTGSGRELAIVYGCLAQILMDGSRYSEAESVLLGALADLCLTPAGAVELAKRMEPYRMLLAEPIP